MAHAKKRQERIAGNNGGGGGGHGGHHHALLGGGAGVIGTDTSDSERDDEDLSNQDLATLG